MFKFAYQMGQSLIMNIRKSDVFSKLVNKFYVAKFC